MIRKRFGRTGLSISALSLGTVELGMDYGLPGSNSRPTTEAAVRLLHHALDRGINHLDTARAYGEAEAILGAALEGRRREVVITTKVVVHPELAALTESVETSLRMLRTDYVDVVMLHTAPKDELANNEVAQHLLKLRDAGKFRFLGASVYGTQAALEAIEAGVFDCLQIAFSPLDRRPETELFAVAEEADVGLIARSVLLKGALSERYKTLPESYGELKAAVARLEALGIPLPELGYRYVMGEPRLASALAGTAHQHELDELLRYAEAGPLPEDVVAAIRREPMVSEQWLNPGLWPSG